VQSAYYGVAIRVKKLSSFLDLPNIAQVEEIASVLDSVAKHLRIFGGSLLEQCTDEYGNLQLRAVAAGEFDVVCYIASSLNSVSVKSSTYFAVSAAVLFCPTQLSFAFGCYKTEPELSPLPPPSLMDKYSALCHTSVASLTCPVIRLRATTEDATWYWISNSVQEAVKKTTSLKGVTGRSEERQAVHNTIPLFALGGSKQILLSK
jgi:hypothetical protein